eukprot:scaffold22545_cov61-Attheya_sp.AAC.3
MVHLNRLSYPIYSHVRIIGRVASSLSLLERCDERGWKSLVQHTITTHNTLFLHKLQRRRKHHHQTQLLSLHEQKRKHQNVHIGVETLITAAFCSSALLLIASDTSMLNAFTHFVRGMYKRCSDKIKVKRRPAWSNDCANGPDDPKNSERILLDWLVTEGNYVRFRGKGNSGTTKLQLSQ